MPARALRPTTGLLRNPAHGDHRFRRMAITDSGAWRSPIPMHADR